MNIKEALLKSEIHISESYILLSHIIGKDKLFLTVHCDEELSANQEKAFFDCVNRRLAGEPLSYITEKREFYGKEFYVNSNTLIPREETEIIIEESKKIFGRFESINILDLCTGSGCLGISLACEFPFAKVCLSDISSKALSVANENVLGFMTKYNMNGRWIDLVKSDMFENIKGKFDLIVSNPPYIPTDHIDTLDEDVKREPKIALDGGVDGLDFYRVIFEKSKDYLKENGKIILEIGYNQSEDIKLMADRYAYSIYFIKDLQGYNRCGVLSL